ncbi:MAG: ADP-ribosylglycohydrolase family protein [Clostridia bacterium]|nr:ADP-ribosylglycohydrolase family protein [Clostridia bacterium]
MLGAIIGDLVGSKYEFKGIKTKDFPLFSEGCRLTDDSAMTAAVAAACFVYRQTGSTEIFKQGLVQSLRHLARAYPNAGYGKRFLAWLSDRDPRPYNSYGNGSAMRVSPVAYVCDDLQQTEVLAAVSAEVTHNHPEGIKGAQAVAAAVFLARTGANKQRIKEYLQAKYYDLDFTLEQIRADYSFDVSCAGSVPQAIVCFLEAESFEDALRNAVSLGGDSDTQADIAGAIAEAYFGEIPQVILDQAAPYLQNEVVLVLYRQFVEAFSCAIRHNI